jgi:hypothetical protein
LALRIGLKRLNLAGYNKLNLALDSSVKSEKSSTDNTHWKDAFKSAL